MRPFLRRDDAYCQAQSTSLPRPTSDRRAFLDFVELVGDVLDGDLQFCYLEVVKGLSVASEGLLRGDILEEHQDAYHDAGGHVQVDDPEGVRLVHCHLPVPQYPVIQDRKAAFVLVVDHSGQLWQSDHVVLERMPPMWYEALASPVASTTRL